MATIETNILKALLARVAVLTLTPALPIAWPNDDFPGKNPDNSRKPMPASYIRVQHFPNKNERLFLGTNEPSWRIGFLQLTVVTPLDVGPDAANEIAGKIAEHFPADLALYKESIKVKIRSAPDVAAPLDTDISWDVPISVYYEVSA